MKYFIDYQHLPKGAERPLDQGDVVMFEVNDKQSAVILPNVGDFVLIDNSVDRDNRASFSGKVRSRLFRYIRVGENEINCAVNIVVEHADDDWGKLVKE